MKDILSNFASKLQNACRAKHDFVHVPKSKVIEAVLKLFQREGYINGFRHVSDRPYEFKVLLRYSEGVPVFHKITRVSSSGNRRYVGIHSLDRAYNGLGVFVISTSKGVISDRDARILRLGGEVLFSIV